MNLGALNPGAILKRVLSGAAAAGAVAASAGVAVVAAAFALYALMKEWIGQPGAAAVVALVFALIAGGAAMVAANMAAGEKAAQARAEAKRLAELPQQEPGLFERALSLAKERPFMAAGAAVAAGLIAMRNPAMVVTLITGALAKPARRKL